MKKCPKCKETKEFSEFHKNKARKDGHADRCKICVAENYQSWYHSDEERVRKLAREKSQRQHFKQKYGITVEERDAIITKQNGLCAICSTDSPGKNGFHIDHNHSTGRVRGALCRICNWTVGNVEKGWPILIPAIEEYLKLYS